MNFECLKEKTILITGGTGSFGKNFVKYVISHSQAKKVIIFSRDELKQSQMQEELKDERLRFFIGDVRDLPRLSRALRGVDIVVHAAALKQVPTLEYNPFEAVKTNILGSQNIIDSAIDCGVEKVILISTDKAVEPINLYGSTKLCAEKLFISGNSYTNSETKFSSVRYGNVIGSRGSVVNNMLSSKGRMIVKITDERMTRFWITLEQSFNLVLFALNNMEGGEIFVPKIPSMKIVDLFDAISPNSAKENIGIRPGEKLHETLLTKEESRHSIDFGDYYVILPEFVFSGAIFSKYYENGKKLDPGFYLTSDNNTRWFSKEEFRDIIKELDKDK